MCLYLHAQQGPNEVNSGVVIQKGAELFRQDKPKEAINEYLKISRNDTNYASVLHDLSVIYYADSNYVESKKAAVTGLQYYPEKADDWYNLLANSEDKLGNMSQAMAYYDSIIAKYHSPYLPWFNKGITYYDAKQISEAKKCLQQALIINPYYTPAHYQLGILALNEGNLVAALLSFTTSLVIDPTHKYAANSVTYLDNISKMTDDVEKKAAAKKASKTDQFDMIQEIIASKISLDPKYKLKAGLEDPIVRQLQVMLEKLSYNKADTGFWMQYYVPFYQQILQHDQYETFINYIFNGLDLKDIKAYVKKNKKKVDEFSDSASVYFNEIRSTQKLLPDDRRKTEMKYLVVNNELTGKGKIAGVGEKAVGVGPWEIYNSNGSLQSNGVFNDKQEKAGVWEFYHANGKVRVRNNHLNDKPEGKSLSWYDNGQKAGESFYKDGELDGVSTEYFYNGLKRKVEHYKAGKKDGEEIGYTANGIKEFIAHYTNDVEEGLLTYYYKNGKIQNIADYKNGKAEGNYKSYYLNGALKLEGIFKDGERNGAWKEYFNSGQVKSISNYAAGKMEGAYTAYYWNGQPMVKSTYIKDKLEGKFEDFDTDGKLYSDSYYENGKLKDLKFYSKDGATISNANIRNGAGTLAYFDGSGNKTSEGYFTKEGLRSGKSTWYYNDGKPSLVANYKDGILEGESIRYFKNGTISSKVNYTADEENGYKMLYYINGVLQYEGMMANGVNDGTHIQYNQFGKVVSKVYYRDNEQEGFNEYFHPNGKPDIELYFTSGWLKNSKQFDTSGGILQNIDLSLGSGPYVQKKYDGKLYVDGTYKNYYLDGAYKVLFDGSQPGTRYHYKYGIIDSTIRQYYYNGKLQYDGQYNMGERDGKWNYYFDNGQRYYSESYDQGRLNGVTTLYTEQGNLDKEISYNEGTFDGAYKYYGENGQLALICNYQQDDLIGYTYEGKDGKLLPVIPVKNGTAMVTGYYKNGGKSIEMNFEQSEVNGPRRLYFTNGKIAVDGARSYGYDHGTKKVYLPDGTLNSEENYYYDNLHGSVKKYHPNGKLLADENYYNGSRHGINKYFDSTGKLIETRTYYYGSLQTVVKS
ncbi:MAG: tetratricopeptide repeat protein [Chitinophagaceae bacterium]|nr:tetratricopeptide repeat protein [Chitinophagaceae bacterium]